MRAFCVCSRRVSRPPPWSYPHSFRCGEHRRVRVEWATAAEMGLVLVTEVLDGRQHRARGAITQRAERLPKDGVGAVEQLVEVAPLARTRFQAFVDLRKPVGALAARRALPARLVGVELRPPAKGAHDTGGLVDER